MSDTLNRFLPGLRSHNASIRTRTARELRHSIESESRDVSHNHYIKWVSELSSKLMELCNSNDTLDKISGIAAMDELIEVFIAERNDQIIIEFAHSLTKVFEKIPSADLPTLKLASKALGHIVSTAGTRLIEFVEDYHVTPALTWLQNDSFQVRRHAATMILKELAVNAPSTAFRHIEKCFDVIWCAFWDSKIIVRMSAADSLQSYFSLIQQRESNRKSGWYLRALEEANRAFARNNSDFAHGALLIINELLRNSGDFMHPHFSKICRKILEHREHRNSTVRSAVINLFPRLAKFNVSAFSESCYALCMNHLLEVLHNPSTSTRGDALLSTGKLALAIGPGLARDSRTLGGIMSGIKFGLREVKKKDSDTHKEALACLRMLAEAVGSILVRVDLESILLVLFHHDLDSSLVETLTTIIKKIPSQRSVIQLRLFERISTILSITRSTPENSGSNAAGVSRARIKASSITATSTHLLSIFSNAITQTKTATGATTASSDNTLQGASEVVSAAIYKQALALETLAAFDFQGNRHIPIMQFVHEQVVKFLDHEATAIRKSAALTCCKLLLPSNERNRRLGRTVSKMEDFDRPVSVVLERLLTVGIADTDASIRLQVLESLDARFDPLLGQDDNLRCLFISLHDEVFEIRQRAMSTLGRLAHHNPSVILPSLRQTLVQLLAELEYSGDTQTKEEAAVLVGCLLRSASHLAKPYVLPILSALMKNLRQDSVLRSRSSRSTVSVSKAILATLGDLAQVAADEFTPYLHLLLPEVIDEMREASNAQILQVAIKSLGQLISSTGYVCRPYHEYPELLDLLCQALQKSGDANASLRMEAGRTIGILGALDPYDLRLFHLEKQGKLPAALKYRIRSAHDPNHLTETISEAGMDIMTMYYPQGNRNNWSHSTTTSASFPFLPNALSDGKDELLDMSFLLVSRERKDTQKEKQKTIKNGIVYEASSVVLEVPPEDLLPSMIGNDAAQYFPTVAVNALTRILLEARNSVHYQGTFVAVMYICKTLRKRIEPHLPKIIPAFLYTLDKANSRSLRKFLFDALCDLIEIVEEQIQSHLDHNAMLAIVHQYWDEYMEEVLNIVKKLAISLGEGFRVYLPDLIPQLLRVIRSERDTPSRPRTLLVLKTTVSLGRLLDGYLHLIIPALVTMIQSEADLNARKQALGSLGSLVKKLNVSVFASKIIHTLARVIATQSELIYLAMDCLCCMVYTMGDDYAIFVPVISQVLGRQATSSSAASPSRTQDIFDRYDLLVSKILKHQPLPVASWATTMNKEGGSASAHGNNSGIANTNVTSNTTSTNTSNSAQEELKTLPCDQKNLIKAWEASQCSTKEDWSEWMRAFSVELLRESPSPVLRACKELASVYQPLARELFNAAFVSVWPHLSSPTQDNLIRALETAFQSAQLPSEILQTLLNLAEFMEHDDQSLPIDIRLLGSLAEKCHSFAKALHYKELEFNTNPVADGIQALISINSKLNQPEAARGILKYALDHLPGLEVKASWHEKLLRWDDALATYDRILQQHSNDVEAIFGKMRCLFAIGEWNKLNDHVQETWTKIYGQDDESPSGMTDEETSSQNDTSRALSKSLLDVPPALKKELCSNGAQVALLLQNWDTIPKYINSDMEETQAHMFRALVAIRNMELDEAMDEIKSCRKTMDPTLRSLVSESYARAYAPSIVRLQCLTELEEIVAYLDRFTAAGNGDITLLNPAPTSSMATSVNVRPSILSPVLTGKELSRQKESIRQTFVSTPSISLEHDKQLALERLQKIWTHRILGVERNIEVWQDIMLVRTLVFDAREDLDIWLKYSRLCSKAGHLKLAATALWRVGAQPFIRSIQNDPYAPLPINLTTLTTNTAVHGLGNDTNRSAGPSMRRFHTLANFGDGSSADPRVALSYLRHLWAENREDIALKQMSHLIDVLEQQGDESDEEMIRLRVQAYIQLSEWQMSSLEPGKQFDQVFEQVLSRLETATRLEPTNHKAWREWALMNFRAIEVIVRGDAHEKNSNEGRLPGSVAVPGPASLIEGAQYAPPAIQGFFRSISFGHTQYDFTKDVLRLLTLWFAYGNSIEVHETMTIGFQEVSIDTWLDVIPQLIARIDSPHPRMNELLHELLVRIGFAHPQALIYPITVASKAMSATRKSAAEGILAAVRRHSPKLVYEAAMVSRELIRVAILWNELWYGALEEASKHYFNNHDAEAMIAELAPLHQQIDSIGLEEAPTLREVAFFQAFARDLRCAKAWTNVYEQTKNVGDLNQAWDIYYNIFSKIRKQLTHLSTLELANVGPKLLSVHGLSLAVPGTYKTGAPIVRIQSFDSKVTVLTSKQRPRKVTINGSDGKVYPFLLKGHEDLRQDERVMQLFGVINTLLANDNDTSKRNLSIERYSVLPLSHTSGLIGWVPNCDTLHLLIRDYREARKIQLNVEHRLMIQMAPDYDKLPLFQKIEAFQYALGETTGQDLYRVLWLKSQDSEVWLDRRRNYTRSLAVMSMAGYILGLGDRHPSNLMLDRISGKIVHIDFGDCFEVAMERDKYPEKIPFRLTRMLTQAMEVSGIEGNFRYTCEASMRVLRENRDSLMAVLEAFVYDPLINWRLLKKDTMPSHAEPQPPHGAVHSSEQTNDPTSLIPSQRPSPVDEGTPVDDELIDTSSAKNAGMPAGEDCIPSVVAGPTRHRRFSSSGDSLYGGFQTNLVESLGNGDDLGHETIHDPNNISQSLFTDVALPQLNAKALSVVERVKKKLAGRDFDDGKRVLSVQVQVDRLIQQATSHENLCQLYYGWCPFW